MPCDPNTLLTRNCAGATDPRGGGPVSETLRNQIRGLKLRYAQSGDTNMKEPGLDGRHRDMNPPKAGEIQEKRGDTLNKNLPSSDPFAA